ncbi:MAG: sugar ABC transporter permease [Clostridia bacterium]|nr:sugar ABC transporter permease [Clostridia bacterium]
MVAVNNRTPQPRRSWRKTLARNEGFFYVLPWLLGFLVFTAYPFISSLRFSFMDYNLFKSGTKWIGFKNYLDILNTSKYIKAYKTTFKYALLTVPIKLAFSLFIAYILNFKIRFVNFFRTAYYIPSILGSSVAISVVWRFVFKEDGIINRVLGMVGISPVPWFGSTTYAIWIIVLLHVWQFGSAMVIFLAALKGVPADLYEAAEIDGAGKLRQFFSITVPMITPVVFYNLITQLCTAFQEFNSAYLITQGGPRGSTTLISLLIYQKAFLSYDMGLASAMAWLLFVIVAIFTAIAFLSQKYWVYYSGDER